jgi:hypothetical protein
MPIERNFITYQESISRELQAGQNRIRHLIGAAHWQTDGEHKESMIRNLLRIHAPETVRIGRGFVCYPSSGIYSQRSSLRSSSQLDILITSRNKPTLYKDGDLVFVTADAVEAVIEVKTRLTNSHHNRYQGLANVLEKLACQAEQIRIHTDQTLHPWIGLFVFEIGDLTPQITLETLQGVTHGNFARVVNCIVLGRDTFIKFWGNGEDVDSPVAGPVWHSYELERLAPTYFIGNCISKLSRGIPNNAADAWFPIEGTKEVRRRFYVPCIDGGTVESFDRG